MSQVVDRTTFDRLVLEHLPAAQTFAIRLTGDVHSAEDVVQDALLRAHRGWTGFRGQSKFKTWLFQIILNCFRDHLSKLASARSTAGLPTESLESHESGPRLEAQSRELSELIAAEVSKLPARQREVLVLMTYEQFPIAQVAQLLEMTEQNVRTTLHYAREHLREKLARHLEPQSKRHE